MTVDIEQFLIKEDFEGYEDPAKFETFKPKIEKYLKALNDGIKPEYSITLPKSIDELVKEQFNPIEYLYKEKLLTEKEFEITDTPGVELVKQMSEGKLTAVEVFKAFVKRGTICHQFTNCAMDLFPEEGLAQAEALDEYYKKNGKIIGPLHGLPISLKEQMDYKGHIRHASYVSQIDHVCEEHGASAAILGKLGAVFYIRTTQPQTLMHLDSAQNITGYTRNPYNMSLSPGGSSSGEGSISAFGGSIIGMGSDIGGSIRGPSAFSGSHGLRPTSKRIGLLGGLSSGGGQESVMAVAGPMCRSMDDIELCMKAYINDGKPWEFDQNCLRMPWREVPKPAAKDLTIAVMYDDGIVKPTPPMERGLKETVAKLEKAGVKIVEFKPIKTELAWETVKKMYNCDGNYMQKKLLAESGEPLFPLTRWALNFGEGKTALTVAENRQLNIIRDQLRNEYNRFLLENKIDFVLSPSYNNVAPKPNQVYNWSYTGLWNILDFPTMTIQTGLFQDPKVDKYDESFKDYKFRSPVEELELTNYKPEEFVGAPIGLQLSGLRYTDEEVVAASKLIVEILDVDLTKIY
ncbi:putative acetamidase [[Candida] jaroonii]|uniref:Acetamidase n=1 Tax=[Candida] jaroonii TaxID=467808 RepID=A0ACA9Y0T9_9ASCO|nr:putative acetamidase [[Candida] jaroonii]